MIDVQAPYSNEFTETVKPRPLSYSLEEYWRSLGERKSVLGYQWDDKPHRHVYSLIAYALYLQNLLKQTAAERDALRAKLEKARTDISEIAKAHPMWNGGTRNHSSDELYNFIEGMRISARAILADLSVDSPAPEPETYRAPPAAGYDGEDWPRRIAQTKAVAAREVERKRHE